MNWLTLEQILDRAPLQVMPDTSILDAIVLMSQGQENNCILVADGTRLLGIFTERDAVRLTASGIDLAGTEIARAMTEPVISLTLDENQNVPSVLSLMRQHRIRHLPVVDELGQLVGLVSRDRIYEYEAIAPEQMLTQRPVNRPGEEEFEENRPRETALQQDRDWWQALFENALDAIAIADDEGRYVDANPAACALFGVSKEELLRSRMADFADPALDVERMWQQFLEQGEMSGEFHLRCPDGTVRDTEIAAVANFIPHHHLSILRDVSDREEQVVFEDRTIWTLTTLSPVRNEAGQIYRIVGTATDISDRKQSERALLELTIALEHAVEGISRLDTRGHYLSVNKAYANAAGYSQTEMMGMAWQVTVHSEDLAKLEAAYQQMLHDGKVEVEARGVRKDGSLFDKQLVMIASYDEQENFIGHYCFMKDISDRKQAEAERQQLLERSLEASAEAEASRNQIATILKSITDGFIALSRDWRFIYVNQQGAEILQRNSEELMGQPVWEVFPEAINTAFYAQYHRVMLEQIAVEFEEFYAPLNTWFAVHAYPTPDGLVAYFQDITQRKLAEQKICEQAALLDIASDAIFVRDLKHRILYWNRGAERLYGWSAAEAMGQKANELLQSDPARVAEIVQTLLERGEWRGELQKVAKTSQEITVEASWTLVRNEAGQPTSILSVETDITEKKQLEAQFYHAQRLESLGTLASGIAHDLNNVLTPILAISQLLRHKEVNLDERSQEMLKMLEESSKRGANLVKQILTFARGSEGARVSVSVIPVLQEVVQVIQQTFPKSIAIRQNLVGGEIGFVSADPTQLHQVLVNLCVNARDAMPEGGVLALSAENYRVDEMFAQMHLNARVGNYVCVTIADTGTGIPAEVRDRIFEPFFTTKEIGKGTGLGLSTVLGIVKSYGGFLEFQSQLGAGSQFKVYLPILEAFPALVEEQTHLPRGRGESILVVDDEVNILQAAQRILENHNYRVLTANNGIEAIARYVEHKQEIQVVLMDMMMPEMDGVNAIQALRKINPQVKIVAVSGLASGYQKKAQSLGIDTFLSKPFSAAELLQSIQTAISKQ